MNGDLKMNIAYFLTTKSEVAYLYNDYSLRQGLEKMKFHKYTAIPVLTRDNRYIGTVSEGDFLWYIMNNHKEEIDKEGDIFMQRFEDVLIKDVLNIDKNPPVPITSTMEDLITSAMVQNFIPVIDDRKYFIGIITRKDIIKYFMQQLKEQKKETVVGRSK